MDRITASRPTPLSPSASAPPAETPTPAAPADVLVGSVAQPTSLSITAPHPHEALSKTLFYGARASWIAGLGVFVGGVAGSFFSPLALGIGIAGGLGLELSAGVGFAASNKLRGFEHPVLASVHPTWRWEDMASRSGDLHFS